MGGAFAQSGTPAPQDQSGKPLTFEAIPACCSLLITVHLEGGVRCGFPCLGQLFQHLAPVKGVALAAAGGGPPRDAEESEHGDPADNSHGDGGDRNGIG
jgi:hypothetical protein